LYQLVSHFSAIVSQLTPEVVEWFIQIIDPDIHLGITLTNLNGNAAATNEWFTILSYLGKVGEELEQFAYRSALPAWVTEWCFQ
jgi:hypothetical protein